VQVALSLEVPSDTSALDGQAGRRVDDPDLGLVRRDDEVRFAFSDTSSASACRLKPGPSRNVRYQPEGARRAS